MIDCAIEVHRTSGAGLLENTYGEMLDFLVDECLILELKFG